MFLLRNSTQPQWRQRRIIFQNDSQRIKLFEAFALIQWMEIILFSNQMDYTCMATVLHSNSHGKLLCIRARVQSCVSVVRWKFNLYCLDVDIQFLASPKNQRELERYKKLHGYAWQHFSGALQMHRYTYKNTLRLRAVKWYMSKWNCIFGNDVQWHCRSFW